LDLVLALAFHQRFRMAWEFTWPMAAIDVLVVLLVHGAFESGGETWDSIWAVVSFIAVWPWVIRRALVRQYGGRKIAVKRPGAQYSEKLRYQESLKVMWLLAWRTLVLSLVALLAVSLLLRLAGGRAFNLSTESPLVNGLGLSLVDAISNLLFLPLIIPGMLKKRFRGFQLELTPP
jgi:hypothetical protein